MACFVRLSILYMRWKSARESEEFSPLRKGGCLHSLKLIKRKQNMRDNDSAMKQKAKNINIDYIVFLNTTDDDDFFNTTRFFLSFFLSFSRRGVARLRFY